MRVRGWTDCSSDGGGGSSSIVGLGCPLLEQGWRRDVSKGRLVVGRLNHSDADTYTDAYADTYAKRGNLQRLMAL